MALLETLVMHCTNDLKHFDKGHPDHCDTLPELDLRGCSNLRAVALQMHLPESCFFLSPVTGKPYKSGQWKPLLKALRGMGEGYDRYTILQRYPLYGVHWMANVEQGREKAAKTYFSACRCGACWECLTGNGALERLLCG